MQARAAEKKQGGSVNRADENAEGEGDDGTKEQEQGEQQQQEQGGEEVPPQVETNECLTAREQRLAPAPTPAPAPQAQVTAAAPAKPLRSLLQTKRPDRPAAAALAEALATLEPEPEPEPPRQPVRAPEPEPEPEPEPRSLGRRNGRVSVSPTRRSAELLHQRPRREESAPEAAESGRVSAVDSVDSLDSVDALRQRMAEVASKRQEKEARTAKKREDQARRSAELANPLANGRRSRNRDSRDGAPSPLEPEGSASVTDSKKQSSGNEAPATTKGSGSADSSEAGPKEKKAANKKPKAEKRARRQSAAVVRELTPLESLIAAHYPTIAQVCCRYAHDTVSRAFAPLRMLRCESDVWGCPSAHEGPLQPQRLRLGNAAID